MRRPRPRWLAVPALAALAWASVPGDDPGRSYEWGGRPVRNAEEVLLAAERDLLATVAGGSAVGPTTGCWFSEPAAGGPLSPFLRCGPVLHPGGRPIAQWDTYPLASRPDGGGVRLDLAGPPDRGGRFPAGEELSRPDGEPPPTADPAPLEPPPAPGLPPGFADVSRRVDGADLRPVEGLLAGPEQSRVRLVGLGRLASVRVEGEDRRPAGSEELLVASLTVEGRVDGMTVEVVTGERRVPLPDELGTGSQFVVASVPAAADASLEIAYGSLAQALSLRTGERLPGAPELLYAPRSVELGVVVPAQEVDPGGGAYPARLLDYRIGKASLLAHAAWLGWADRGSGWLVVDVGNLQAPSVVGAAVRVDIEHSFFVVLEDGAGVAATDLNRPPFEGTLVAFAVPESLRRATLRVTPTFAVTGPDRAPSTLAFAAVEVPIGL